MDRLEKRQFTPQKQATFTPNRKANVVDAVLEIEDMAINEKYGYEAQLAEMNAEIQTTLLETVNSMDQDEWMFSKV